MRHGTRPEKAARNPIHVEVHMAGERIPACALYLVRMTSPGLAQSMNVADQDCNVKDLAVVHDQIQELQERDIKLIMGDSDDIALESFNSSVILFIESIVEAVTHREVWKRSQSVETRAHTIITYADKHIWRWSQDRGMDPDMVESLLKRVQSECKG